MGSAGGPSWRVVARAALWRKNMSRCPISPCPFHHASEVKWGVVKRGVVKWVVKWGVVNYNGRGEMRRSEIGVVEWGVVK